MEEEILEKFYEYYEACDSFGDHNISYSASKALLHFV